MAPIFISNRATALLGRAVIALTVLIAGCAQSQPPQAPTFTSAPVRSATVGETYLYLVNVVSVQGTADITIELEAGPEWLRFTDAGSGRATLQGTPGRDDVGDHDVRVRAWDRSANLARIQEFTVRVRIAPATAIAVGVDHSLMVTASGELYSWGSNSVGQLGLGTINGQANTPRRVTALDGVKVVSVAAGQGFSLALDSDGGVWSWGRLIGDPNDPPLVRSTAPEPVPLPAGVTASAIAAGRSHAIVATAGSGIFAWGENASGQLGTGTFGWSTEPLAIDLNGSSLDNAAAIAAGASHSLALSSDGVVYAWGLNFQGALGLAPSVDEVVTPQAVPLTTAPGGVRMSAIDAAAQHSVAVARDGQVYVWGWNSRAENLRGAFGHKMAELITTPTALLSFPPSNVQAARVHTARSYTLIHATNGAVYAVGSNTHGTFGDGTTLSRDDPVRAALLSSGEALQLVTLAVGPEHVVAIDSDGALYAWGSNAQGRLGDGGSASSDRPIRIR